MTDGALPRAATPDDASACARIVSDWLTQTAWMKNVPDLDELTEMMVNGIPMREFWVIGDPVVGYLSLEEGINHIHGLYVAERGQGHGKALVDAAKDRRDYLQLWTHGPNTDAHRFYHREGFVTVEEKPEGRGDGLPELRMEWRR